MKVSELWDRLSDLPGDLEVFTTDFTWGDKRTGQAVVVGCLNDSTNKYVLIESTDEILGDTVDHEGRKL